MLRSASAVMCSTFCSSERRIEADGPNVPFPPHRIVNLKDHAEASEELAEILSDAAKTISLAAHPQRRRGIRGMWTKRGLPPRR